MITREYKLNKPDQVRSLILLDNQDINIALSLLYAHNATVSDLAYVQRRQRERGVELWQAGEIDRLVAKKHHLRGRLKQVLALHRMRIVYGTGGRIESLIFKKTRRSVPRPTGSLLFASQKALFPFSDMYSDERFNEWLVNRIITQGETR